MSKRWRGLKALVHDAVDATVELVQEGHDSAARVARRVTDEIEPIREPAAQIDEARRLATAGVLGSVKFVNRGIEKLSDAALELASDASEDALEEPPVALSSAATGSRAWLGDAALGLVNAAVGDHLARRASDLALAMVFRLGDHYLLPDLVSLEAALESARPKLAIFVHGLGTTEWSWSLEAEAYHGDPHANFATLLSRDLDYEPVFLRYNTGLHISENGKRFAELLESLVSAYPNVAEELVIFGHSMGGLVARSAAVHAEQAGMRWPSLVTNLFYLGSPHRGAPLAKLGHALGHTLSAIDLPATRVIGRVLETRSAGVKDLRHGALLDEEWTLPHPLERETLPLAHARHHFISATVTQDAEHPIGQLIGDLLVRSPSANGPRENHAFSIDVTHYGGVLHHHLQNHPAVYEAIRTVLGKSGLQEKT